MRKLASDSGSLTVELVVLTPVLFILAVTVLAFGRLAEAREQVVESARAGAQMAALAPDGAAAQQAAEANALTGSVGRPALCPSARVSTDLSHFYPGGWVTVTVVCPVSLSDLAAPGVPGSTTVQASATAPIDPYRSVGAASVRIGRGVSHGMSVGVTA